MEVINCPQTFLKLVNSTRDIVLVSRSGLSHLRPPRRTDGILISQTAEWISTAEAEVGFSAASVLLRKPKLF